MKPEEFDRAIARGEFGPLYYLHGDEPFLMERCVQRLLAKLVPPDFRDFNLNIYYGAEARGEEVAEVAQTLPMFADRRVVLVKRSEGLSAAALEALLPYVQDPAPSTCLVFQGEKADLRRKFFGELKKSGELVEYRRLYENQLAPFLREEAATLGKRLDPGAADYLVSLVGNNLQELVTELDKVVTFVGQQEIVRVDDVRAVASATRVDSVFELANALGEKDLAKALRRLEALLRDGEAPLMLLAMVTRHFRQLWQVAELLGKKLAPSEIARQTGISPYFLKGVTAQARHFRRAELQRIFEKFYATDLALKSSGGKPAVLMERLIMEICGLSGK